MMFLNIELFLVRKFKIQHYARQKQDRIAGVNN